MMEDLALLDRWRAGDQAAGNELFKRSFDSLYRFFVNKTRNGADAEDLLQKTFEAMVAGRDRFEGRSTFQVYSLGIAYNVLRHHYRRLARERALHADAEVSIADLGAGPHSHLEVAEQQRFVAMALRQIPMDFQLVIELRYFDGQDLDAIAEILGVNVNTVRSRLWRGREKLLRKMDELSRAGDDPAGPALDMEGLEQVLGGAVGPSSRR